MGVSENGVYPHGSFARNINQWHMVISGSWNGGTVPCKAICCGDIPYIDLIYGRYPQFRFLKWPLNQYYPHQILGSTFRETHMVMDQNPAALHQKTCWLMDIYSPEHGNNILPMEGDIPCTRICLFISSNFKKNICLNGGFHTWRYPIAGWLIMENPWNSNL